MIHEISLDQSFQNEMSFTILLAGNMRRVRATSDQPGAYDLAPCTGNLGYLRPLSNLFVGARKLI